MMFDLFVILSLILCCLVLGHIVEAKKGKMMLLGCWLLTYLIAAWLVGQ